MRIDTSIPYKEYIDLKKIIDYEDSVEADSFTSKYGWLWYQVAIQPGKLNKYVTEGYIDVIYSTRKATHYLLTDKGEELINNWESALANESDEGSEGNETDKNKVVDVSNLFIDIIGYPDLKHLFKETLQLDAEKPIHILLHSPPAMAKSLFLWDIERAFGSQVLSFLGSGTSLPGMWDLVVERKPKIILIDEIDKMGIIDTSALLSLMESGRIIRAKVGRNIDEKVNVQIIAAANKIGKMSAELLSRFAKFKLESYLPEEYHNVVKNVVVRYEGVDKDSASEIALRLSKVSLDVRDAIRVARLSKRVGVEQSIKLLFGADV